MVDIFRIVGIVGLIFIIFGTLLISSKKVLKRRYTYPFLLIGGIFLLIYSFHINDKIFIILQSIYIIITLYGLIKMHEERRKTFLGKVLNWFRK